MASQRSPAPASTPSLQAPGPSLPRRRLLRLGVASIAAAGTFAASRSVSLASAWGAAESYGAGRQLPQAVRGPLRGVVPGLAADVLPPPPPPADGHFTVSDVFSRGDPGRDALYLTIDDCYASRLVGRAMDAAEAGGARLTFFPTGAAIASQPALWRDAVARGHGVENHSYSHRAFPRLKDQQIRDEIESTATALDRALGYAYPRRFVRLPGGAGANDARVIDVIRGLGLKVAMWNADSNGWRVANRTDDAAVNYALGNVLAHFGRGTIVIQHAIEPDVTALPAIIAEAAARGLCCISLREGLA